MAMNQTKVPSQSPPAFGTEIAPPGPKTPQPKAQDVFGKLLDPKGAQDPERLVLTE
jgi:hypothetical protein